MTTDSATIDSEEVNENLRIIRLVGRLDMQGVNAVDTQFAFLAASQKHRIVVDLTGLDFIASIGVRALVSNAKAQQQRGGRLVLFVGDNNAVIKVLTTTGIDSLIPMFKDAAEASQAALAEDGVTSSDKDMVAEISVNADASDIRRASVWLEKNCLEQGVPEDQIQRLDLCLNEVMANIMTHGGPLALSAPVQLQVQVRGRPTAGEVVLTVSDAGVEFDPLAFHSKPRPKTLSEAEPGGLGLTMMHNFSDNLGYRYSEGRNQTVFTVRW